MVASPHIDGAPPHIDGAPRPPHSELTQQGLQRWKTLFRVNQNSITRKIHMPLVCSTGIPPRRHPGYRGTHTKQLGGANSLEVQTAWRCTPSDPRRMGATVWPCRPRRMGATVWPCRPPQNGGHHSLALQTPAKWRPPQFGG